MPTYNAEIIRRANVKFQVQANNEEQARELAWFKYIDEGLIYDTDELHVEEAESQEEYEVYVNGEKQPGTYTGEPSEIAWEIARNGEEPRYVGDTADIHVMDINTGKRTKFLCHVTLALDEECTPDKPPQP